jgi:hypothetical protein
VVTPGLMAEWRLHYMQVYFLRLLVQMASVLKEEFGTLASVLILKKITQRLLEVGEKN